MFAYCLNNPVNYTDSSGSLPYKSNIASDRVMIKSDGDSSFVVPTPNNNGETCDDVITHDIAEQLSAIIGAICNNLEFSVGVGQGLAVKIVYCDFGVDIGAYCNYACWQLSDGQWTFGQDTYAGATGTILVYDVGFAHHEFRQQGSTWELAESWIFYNPQQTTITIFSNSCYLLFAGYSISIGFDPIGLCQDIDTIMGG